MMLYSATTENITVSVRPGYLDAESDFFARRFVFAYAVSILNSGDFPVHLLRRRWIIKDGKGNVQEVEGEGVVGKQPIIRAGDLYEYASYCVLPTLEGSMQGSYLMTGQQGIPIQVAIPCFRLVANAN